jgi:protein TonB
LPPRISEVRTGGDLRVAPPEALEIRADPDRAMDLSDVDRPPERLHAPPVMYPHWARVAGKEGRVRVQFIVDAEGRVGDVHLLEVTGEDRFGDVVVEAVRKWRFRPGVHGGRKVPVRCIQSIRFELED